MGITDVRFTQRAGHERDLAAEAAASGIETIVALGGDGTWGNVARGILESGRDARMVPVAGGTGNDFPHALGLPADDPVAMARIAAGTGSTRVDVGWAGDIAFLNVAGFGIETEVLRSTRQIARLTGPLLYVAAALPVLRSYRGFRASIHYDGERPGAPTQWCAIVVSNGPRFGGGFRIAPGASVSDGLADVIAVRDALPMRRLALFVRARLGTHEGQREVERRATPGLTVQCEQPALLDMDGELHRLHSTELRVQIQRAALRVGIKPPD